MLEACLDAKKKVTLFDLSEELNAGIAGLLNDFTDEVYCALVLQHKQSNPSKMIVKRNRKRSISCLRETESNVLLNFVLRRKLQTTKRSISCRIFNEQG